VNLVPLRPEAIRTPARTIYPYSVIRGGAYSVAELNEVLRTDPVVAAHYADFDRTQMRVTRSPAAAAVYVSYRKGDQIYWTTRKVHLSANEPLLSDGVHTARARCGNRISLTRHLPASQTEEPSEIELDLPEAPPSANADMPLDEVSPPRWDDGILPAMVEEWPGEVLDGDPGASEGSMSGSSGFPGGMQSPKSSQRPLSGAFTFPAGETVMITPTETGLPLNIPRVARNSSGAEVPEPGTAAMLICGVAIIAFPRFWRRRPG
jgi:hypothetical protein